MIVQGDYNVKNHDDLDALAELVGAHVIVKCWECDVFLLENGERPVCYMSDKPDGVYRWFVMDMGNGMFMVRTADEKSDLRFWDREWITWRAPDVFQV